LLEIENLIGLWCNFRDENCGGYLPSKGNDPAIFITTAFDMHFPKQVEGVNAVVLVHFS